MEILVVDDDVDFVDFIYRFLVIDDHSVVKAYSGEEALEKVQQQNFDLILSDLKMEGMTGIDLINELRKRKIYSYVIVITGYGTINSAVNAIKAGAYDYLLKPFEYEDINVKIKEVESEIQLARELMVPKFEEKSESDAIDVLNLNEFPGPYLVISKIQNLNEKLNLIDSKVIWVGSSSDSEKSIPPTKLHLIRNNVSKFVEENDTGTIIFHGIEALLKAHTWSKFKQFILYLEKEIPKTDFSILFLTEDSDDQSAQYYDLLLYDALSSLSIEVFKSIFSIISHPIRKGIINLLKITEQLPFNKIARELNIENTSTFTFHIKKLIQEDIIKKQDNNYLLTSRGQYFANVLIHFEKIGLADPSAQVKAFKIPKL